MIMLTDLKGTKKIVIAQIRGYAKRRMCHDIGLLVANLLNLLRSIAGIFAKKLYICTDMWTCRMA
jgi:hypothetical protein